MRFIFGLVLVGLIVVFFVALAFGISYGGLEFQRWYGTKAEGVRTDIYRENKSYVEGTIRDLRELRVDYLKTPAEHKSPMRSIILQRAGELDWDRLPADLRTFLNEIKE